MYTFALTLNKLIEYISRQLSLVGGVIMIILALITVISIIGRTLFETSVTGDYEMMEVGLAIAIFLFLTECQIKKGHVIVDFFTAHISEKKVTTLDSIANIIFGLVAGIIAWRMSLGGLDSFEYLEQTVLLEIPIWIAYVPAVFCLALASLRCFLDAYLGFRSIFINE